MSGPIPSGTVTFAFTDIEGSTQRWDSNRSAMEEALQRHGALVRDAIAQYDGYVFKTLGDGFCAAFSHPADAVAAMLAAQRALAAHDFSALDGLRVRAAIHTGTADERHGDYYGPAVNRAARLLAIGHGGQILLSGVTTAIVQGSLPAETSLRDLGRHRLKDLAQPEQIYQLDAPDLATDFPPLRSLSVRTTNLPLQLTSFVGREKEMADIAALLRSERLVTLVGSGGVGKTRTALHVLANLLDEWDDGVWLIELAPLSSGDHIPAAVAHALGITLGAGDPHQNLEHALKSKHALLLFDNCEHLVEPAARVVAAILGGCPKIHVLATSRQMLDIAGERSYRLPSLDDDPAIALFVERATAVESRFAPTAEDAQAIAEICRRLDGIPLAIELAASRMSVLTLRQLSEMLNDRFRVLAQTRGSRLPRQQTLHATIDWSFDLLNDDERVVFRRLSVFAGGWTLRALAAVCAGEGIDEWQVFELLAGLVTKSLVVAEPFGDEQRYRMLNSIREYSHDRLGAAGEGHAVAAKHARYYSNFVRDLARAVASLEDEQWQHAIAPEIDNIRAALDWAVVRRNAATSGLDLLAELEWPELLTTPQEAVAWFDAAVRLFGEPIDALTKARVMRHLVRLEWLMGRPLAQREQTATYAVAAARAVSDLNEIARSLANLGSVYRDAGRFDEAEATFAQAYQTPDALSAIAANHVLRNWAVSSLQQGDVEAARRRFTEVAKHERPGSEAHASAMLNLGELQFALGNVEAARAAASKARETFARLNAAPLALVICNLAAYALAADDIDDARQLLREALRLLKKARARWMITALDHHALLGGLVGDYERAAALVGFTNAQYAGAKREQTERHGYERLLTVLSEVYEEEELAQRMSAGAWLSEEQALEHAAAISRCTDNKRSVNHG